jgi:hypothetical protein
MNGEHEDLTADGTEATDAPVRGARRRRLTVAAVAAAVLVAGGGTYLAVSGGDRPDGARARVTLPATDRSTFPSEPRTGAPRATALPADPAPAPPGTYRLAGLLPQHGPASAASYHPAGKPTVGAVQELATALGLKGPVRQDAGAWRVGPGDGTGPALIVSTDPQGTWSYASNDGTYSDTAGAPVTEQRAREAAAPLLTALGLTSARVDASQTAGMSRTVTADPLVGGLPTHGWDTGVSIGPDARVSSAHGHLAAPAKGEAVRVVSAAQAFKELPGPQLMHPGALACAAGDAADTAPPRTLPCAPASRRVTVDITGAEFGLTLSYASGGAHLVPAWLFTAEPHGGGAPYVVPQPATA